MKQIVDVIVHFNNGNEKICSARYEGEEERFLYNTMYGKFTNEQEKSYRKFNNPLPIAHEEPLYYIEQKILIPVYKSNRKEIQKSL
jgi:hypothetical protein